MKSKMTCPEACGAGGNVTPDDRFAPSEVANLFEHLVGAAEQRRGDIDAVRFSDADEPRAAILHSHCRPTRTAQSACRPRLHPMMGCHAPPLVSRPRFLGRLNL